MFTCRLGCHKQARLGCLTYACHARTCQRQPCAGFASRISARCARHVKCTGATRAGLLCSARGSAQTTAVPGMLSSAGRNKALKSGTGTLAQAQHSPIGRTSINTDVVNDGPMR
eukprot:7383876-Prymnesium_polylepis.2